MKLQLKLVLYNTLTKIAIIPLTGVIIAFSLERVSYSHIEHRLMDDKNELMKNLSSAEINNVLTSQKIYSDYNILKEQFVQITPVNHQPRLVSKTTFRTARRIIEENEEQYRVLSYPFNFSNHTYLLEIGETIASVEELKSIITKFTLIVLVFALALTLLSDMVFTKYLLNPFYKIIDQKLINVNDPLNFNYTKIKTSTHDFVFLDESINALVEKITNLFLLEKQFIANVSHELLTPISIISSRIENILINETLSEESENKLHASLKTLNRLKSIINGLLLISKVENNQFDKRDDLMIHQIITEIEEELEDRLEDKSIVLTNQLHYQYSMRGNRALLHTLFFNILNNAIKYNHIKGRIIITDRLHNGQYQLEVTDTGTGMDEKEIDKAFNRFEKLDTDERESYGLGLAIVKSIAAFHHVTIQIRSAKNKGTTFLLQFVEKEPAAL
jgi:signal transduction histidine kinase